jgi:hypothetical protein
MRLTSFLIRRLLPWSLTVLGACTDPYMPDVVTSPPNYLVVDGFLNAQGITTIRLSRTYAIASKAAPPAETRATVYIEDEAGTRYPLAEGTAGTYVSAGGLTLNPARRHRLRLKTLSGKEYASDYVPVKITPPIDDVTWRAESQGPIFYVSTHDATNNTQFYRWEIDETWEIRPIYQPEVEYVNRTMRDIVVRYPTICWGNVHSTDIKIDKTTALSQDVVSNFRLNVLAATSARLFTRYSLLVQQHALTRDEYNYWELLRKNTESIGTLFDPQPAQLTGNMHSLSNTAEVVLGFVGAHSLTEKRIFVTRNQLPTNWLVQNGYENCRPPDTVYIDRPSPPPPNPPMILESAFNPQSGILPINRLFKAGSSDIIGYTAKSRDCIDCRTRGTTVKPSYWP